MTDTTVVTEKPLCVDLDGTLVATDTLWEGRTAPGCCAIR